MSKFLQVNKDLFNKGLNPIELLVISQIMEFNRTTGDCFISDKQLAEQFGVSDKTISRALSHLEELGYILRETKNIKGGKERHIRTMDKMTLVNDDKNSTTDKMSFVQQTNCPLYNGQNDLIKDNSLKDNSLKDNSSSQATSWGATPNPLPGAQGKKEFRF